jgi:hypothetical protein
VITPGTVDPRSGETYHRLHAINMMRGGHFALAYAEVYGLLPVNERLVKLFDELYREVKAAYDNMLGRAPWPVYLEAAIALKNARL